MIKYTTSGSHKNINTRSKLSDLFIDTDSSIHRYHFELIIVMF